LLRALCESETCAIKDRPVGRVNRLQQLMREIERNRANSVGP
jgi:hypothetical protein